MEVNVVYRPVFWSIAIAPAAILLIWRLRWSIARRRLGHTCPRCLAVGELEPIELTSDPRFGELVALRCNHVEEDPYRGEWVCVYAFCARYRYSPRLRFGTAGLTCSAGQAHWLIMAVHEFRVGGCRPRRFFERTSFVPNNDDSIEWSAREIIEQRRGPRTQVGQLLRGAASSGSRSIALAESLQRNEQ